MGIQIDGSANTISGLAVRDLPNGSISSDDIASNAVTVDKLASTLDLSSNTVTLPNTSVTAGMLASTLDISGKTVTLPNTSVTAGMLASSLDLTGKTVTLPSGVGGKIVQVQTVVKDNIFSTNSTSFVDVTDLSVSITPSSSSNKILVITSICTGTNNTGSDNFIRLLRGASHTVANDFLTRQAAVSDSYNYVFLRLDNPATTSETTYKLQAKVESDTLRINTRNTADLTSGSSSIVLLEVAPNA